MNEENLGIIFNLIVDRLKTDKNFVEELKEAKNRKFEDKPDSFFFERMCYCVFVSGFRSEYVRQRFDTLRKAFSNYNISEVSKFSEEKIKELMKNPNMIRNEKKIRACINNAKEMLKIVKQFGSFANYIKSFGDNKLELKKNLVKRFAFISRITVSDYLKDIGIDSIKPDVHVRRIFHRLGFIATENDSEETLEEVDRVANKISKVTKEKLGVIDLVFWKYGEAKICKKSNPLCNECKLTKFCQYFRNSKVG
jgi:DNA-3-methyladenine glycosylase I